MAKVNNVRDFSSPTMQLGGKKRIMQFDLNSFAELENRYGTIAAAMEKLQGGRMDDVRTILWAALIHEEVILDPVTGEPTGYHITPYQVGSWIKTPKMLTEASEKLGRAMGEDMPDVENLAKSGPSPSDVKNV